MALLDDMSETARKIFLAGIGAVATGAEMSGQIAEKSGALIEDLVKKGELTVEQGKTLNEELKHKASAASSDTEASILRARLRGMTPEEREAYVAKIAQIKEDLNAEPVEVDGEPVEEPDIEVEVEVEPEGEAKSESEDTEA